MSRLPQQVQSCPFPKENMANALNLRPSLWAYVLLVLLILPRFVAAAETQASGRIDVILWFDTEDYLLPADDDAAKRLAEMLTEKGVRATMCDAFSAAILWPAMVSPVRHGDRKPSPHSRRLALHRMEFQLTSMKAITSASKAGRSGIATRSSSMTCRPIAHDSNCTFRKRWSRGKRPSPRLQIGSNPRAAA